MDVTEAVTQDAIADSLVSEPETESTATAPGTEAEEQVEGQEQFVEQEQQDEPAEDADWLPSEQEKIFPQEVVARYAQRYGFTQDMLNANPSLLNVLHDKINSDILIRQMSARQEEVVPEPEPVQQRPTPQPIPFQQWQQNAQQFIRQNGLLNADVAKAFANQFMSAFGLKESDYPQGFNHEAFTEPFVLFGMNLINSLMPLYFQAPSQTDGQNMFQYLAEQNYDGLGSVASERAYRSAWNDVRSEFPSLAKVSYYSDDFQQLMEKASELYPGLEDTKFADGNGKPLSPKANAVRQYQIAARLVSGQQLSPELARKAFQNGQQAAKTSQARRQAGNLGAGNSKQQFSQQSDDDFWSNPQSWQQYLDKKL